MFNSGWNYFWVKNAKVHYKQISYLIKAFNFPLVIYKINVLLTDNPVTV